MLILVTRLAGRHCGRLVTAPICNWLIVPRKTKNKTLFLLLFHQSMKHNYIIICLDSMFETFCVESWNSIWLLFRLRAFLLPFQHLCLKLLLPFQLQFNPPQLTAPILWNLQTTSLRKFPIRAGFCVILYTCPSNFGKLTKIHCFPSRTA